MGLRQTTIDHAVHLRVRLRSPSFVVPTDVHGGLFRPPKTSMFLQGQSGPVQYVPALSVDTVAAVAVTHSLLRPFSALDTHSLWHKHTPSDQSADSLVNRSALLCEGCLLWLP